MRVLRPTRDRSRSVGKTTGGRLFLPVTLIERIHAEAKRWAPKETGGMLIGYRTRPGARADIVVCEIVAAGPKAKRTNTRFQPDGHWQQKRLEDTYIASNGTHTYLGDWHSHPNGTARPSRTDRRTYARVAAHRDTGTRLPVLLIVSLLHEQPQDEAYLISLCRSRTLSIVPSASSSN